MSVDVKNFLAIFEIALTSAIFLTFCIELIGGKINRRQIIAFGITMIFCLNLFETSIAGWIRGVTGDLSITSLLLLWSAFFISPKPVPPSYQWSVILLAIFFYPCALGLSMFDPYAFGYGSYEFFTLIVLLGFCMWLTKWYRLLVIFSLSILAWCVTLHESTNLWDYLLDPFLVLWCILARFKQIFHFKKILRV